MQLFEKDSARLTAEYGITVGRWEQYLGTEGKLPFGAMWSIVPPGGVSAEDHHEELELAVVISGDGEVESTGDRRPAAHPGRHGRADGLLRTARLAQPGRRRAAGVPQHLLDAAGAAGLSRAQASATRSTRSSDQASSSPSGSRITFSGLSAATAPSSWVTSTTAPA